MSEIKIRRANEDDAAAISSLGSLTFTETFGHLFKDQQDLIKYCTTTFSVTKIEKSFSKPNNLYWIALASNLPVGYAKLKLNSQSEFVAETNIGQLQKIYVLRSFLSLKIGFKLQTILLENAKEKGLSEVWLSVLNSNERAINFYIKNGFTEIGVHDFQIGKENFDFTAMSKKLG